MKQLSSFMVLNIDGGDRVTYTYNEINDSTGEPISPRQTSARPRPPLCAAWQGS